MTLQLVDHLTTLPMAAWFPPSYHFSFLLSANFTELSSGGQTLLAMASNHFTTLGSKSDLDSWNVRDVQRVVARGTKSRPGKVIHNRAVVCSCFNFQDKVGLTIDFCAALVTPRPWYEKTSWHFISVEEDREPQGILLNLKQAGMASRLQQYLIVKEVGMSGSEDNTVG